MLVGLLMTVPAVVGGIVVMGSIMAIGLTVVVGLFMVGRLTLVMEHTRIGTLTRVVRLAMVVGLTEVVGPIVMSSATLMVIIIKGLLIIGMVRESSAKGKRCGLVGSIMMGAMAVVGGVEGVVGMEGESLVRQVLDLTKVVRFAMRMGHVMMVDSSIVWSVLWG